jgi:hypothetical protein
MLTVAVRTAPVALAVAVRVIGVMPVPAAGVTASQFESLVAVQEHPGEVRSVAAVVPPVEATFVISI